MRMFPVRLARQHDIQNLGSNRRIAELCQGCIVKQQPDRDRLLAYAAEMIRGCELGNEFADDNRWAADGSLFSGLLGVTRAFDDPRYTDRDARFVVECVRAYMAIASAQMRGVASLLSAGPPVQLHPLMTMIRAQAEACGSAWWLMGPLLDDEKVAAMTAPTDVIARNFDTLDRSKTTYLDQLRTRQARLKVSGDISLLDDAARKVEAYESELVVLHGVEGLKWSQRKNGTRKDILGIGSLTPPQLTEVVMIAVEYAYGQDQRGEEINLYKLFSGYAHGSIEMFFSHGQTAWLSLVGQVSASEGECRDFSNLTLRMYYQLLETLVRMMGRDVTAVDVWGASWWDRTLG